MLKTYSTMRNDVFHISYFKYKFENNNINIPSEELFARISPYLFTYKNKMKLVDTN